MNFSSFQREAQEREEAEQVRLEQMRKEQEEEKEVRTTTVIKQIKLLKQKFNPLCIKEVTFTRY